MKELAEKLHEWYLEATKQLNPESYNPAAQKSYSELTEEQKFIDRYIANKVLQAAKNAVPKEKRVSKMWDAYSTSVYNQAIQQTLDNLNKL